MTPLGVRLRLFCFLTTVAHFSGRPFLSLLPPSNSFLLICISPSFRLPLFCKQWYNLIAHWGCFKDPICVQLLTMVFQVHIGVGNRGSPSLRSFHGSRGPPTVRCVRSCASIQSLLFRIHSQAVRVFACACFGASNTLHPRSSFCSHAGHSLRLHLAILPVRLQTSVMFACRVVLYCLVAW